MRCLFRFINIMLTSCHLPSHLKWCLVTGEYQVWWMTQPVAYASYMLLLFHVLKQKQSRPSSVQDMRRCQCCWEQTSLQHVEHNAATQHTSPVLHPRVRSFLKSAAGLYSDWRCRMYIRRKSNQHRLDEAVVSTVEQCARRGGRPGFESQTAVQSLIPSFSFFYSLNLPAASTNAVTSLLRMISTPFKSTYLFSTLLLGTPPLFILRLCPYSTSRCTFCCNTMTHYDHCVAMIITSSYEDWRKTRLQWQGWNWTNVANSTLVYNRAAT